MSIPFKAYFSSLLELPVVGIIRRNHGLEHATLHVLAQRFPQKKLAGHSDARGFWLLGDVGMEDVAAAVEEAKRRMVAGERSLAIHPNCGTNFVTAGVMAGLAAFAALFGARRTRDKLERLPMAASLATLALIAAQPMGLWIQEWVTTSGEVQGLELVEIFPASQGRVKAHRVVTRWG